MLELLKAIPLEGATITGDAAFTRKYVARAILKGGGDYFLTVKGNHKMLREDIASAFRSAPYQRFFSAGLDKAELTWERKSNQWHIQLIAEYADEKKVENETMGQW